MIIGLTGPICAGKDEVARILVSMGFKRFSLFDEIKNELKEKNISLTRDHIQHYADSARRKEGVGVWARKIIKKLPSDVNCVVDSIRNPGEVEEFRELGDFFLVKVDAPSKLRFARMVKRAREQDPKTFEEFEILEEKDLGIGQPDYGQQHAQCFAFADKTVVNEGTLEKLHEIVSSTVDDLREISSSWTSLPYKNINEPAKI